MSGLRSGRTVHGTEKRSVDVVVVGSGAGGASAAYELVSAGLDVLVLEAGPSVRPEEFNQRELDTVKRFYVDQGAQGPANGSISVLQGRMVGGSTVINGEVCFRIPDFVLEEWKKEFNVHGFSSAEMKSAFDTVERMIHATPNEERYQGSGRKFAEGLVKLGVEPKPVSRSVKDCRGCCYCFFGCAYGCKQSTDQSYLPAAFEKGASLVSEARVEKITFNGGRATGVVARTPEGTIEVSARAVVLACGSIETPLMLLDHGLGGRDVGRHLALHPVLLVLGYFEEDQNAYRNAMISTYTDAFVGEGYLIELAAASPPFSAPVAAGFGRTHKEAAREVGKAAGGGAIIRDVGSLGRVRRGRGGAKVIDYALDAPTKDKVRRAMKKMGEIAFACGAKKLGIPITIPFEPTSVDELRTIDSLPLGPADIAFVSYHPQGTARLGTVTDLHGAVRGVRDLYVMDASLFPSPVGVNTQEPVMGVATVLARRLADKLGGHAAT
jgi:choline dehydrogenase-like flavoprotein